MITDLSVRFVEKFEGEDIAPNDIAGMVQATGINKSDPEEIELDIFAPDNIGGSPRKYISLTLADFRRLVGAVQQVEEAQAQNQKGRAS